MSKQDTNTGNNIQASDNWCYYYLHENGDLIHKSYYANPSDFEDSDFVKKWWKVNMSKRIDVYNFLIAASMFGANKCRVDELIWKWHITDHDCEHYIDRVGLTWLMDGNAWCVHAPDFIDLQNSTAGFSSESLFYAIVDFYKNLLDKSVEKQPLGIKSKTISRLENGESFSL